MSRHLRKVKMIGKINVLIQYSEGPVRSLHTMFPEIEKDYHILKVIGSGTFSSVFKAIDLKHHELDNSAWDTQPAKRYFTRLASSSPKMVAIKQVYAFASVKRIFAEIDFLLTIRHTQCKQLLAIITSLRYQDQVLIVLPYGESHKQVLKSTYAGSDVISPACRLPRFLSELSVAGYSCLHARSASSL